MWSDCPLVTLLFRLSPAGILANEKLLISRPSNVALWPYIMPIPWTQLGSQQLLPLLTVLRATGSYSTASSNELNLLFRPMTLLPRSTLPT